jgi:hypothetical protein
MGKAITYITILAFTLIFFMFFGIINIDDLSAGSLLKLLTNPETLVISDLYRYLFEGLFTALIMNSALALGMVQRVNMVDTVVAAVSVMLMVNFFWDMLVVFNTIKVQVGLIYATLFVGPLVILGLLILVEWFRGKD